ncbi:MULTISPECIES: DNA ligase D [Sutcliffiella]|uniref:DNA ligase D n=1 Tax=Sutcliffiella TaxID=2837511 RepID=UPI000AF1F1F3|nr:DNA ligase D [Sutcliffiella cohnii]
MLKPMLPTLHANAPMEKEWVYEIKYDGFRCITTINKNTISLQSRNGQMLNDSFPEVVRFLETLSSRGLTSFPVVLDCELAVLQSDYKANFQAIQKRGRTKTQSTVEHLAKEIPATLCAFDLLQLGTEQMMNTPYIQRKEILLKLFKQLELPENTVHLSDKLLQYVPFFNKYDDIWNIVLTHDSEGIIAKKTTTKWEGKRTTNWIKVKNYKIASCFITAYQKDNGYFHIGVFDQNEKIVSIGLFSHGLTAEERSALLQVIKNNNIEENDRYIKVPPSICVDIHYLELYDKELRHPEFKQFRLDLQPNECTISKIMEKKVNIPESVQLTHPDKPIWENPLVTKEEYIHYLVEVAPHFLSFLKDRPLTVIRYPHGMFGESFYQKNCPDYAPNFVQTVNHENIEYIVCNNLETLCWLGNQLAIEYHIPFQPFQHTKPSEIVFDLDPPSVDQFSYAIKAAKMMKEVFDQLNLHSFVKTSGRKGIQVYIPLPDDTFTYEQTRTFTEFIANYLISKEPSLFTIERLKKNRNNKLYIDYIQHWEGKTIIAPFSPRGSDFAGIAMPLYWDEVQNNLLPKQFTMKNVVQKLKEDGDPFQSFWNVKEKQPFEPVLQFLRKV